MTQEKIDTNGQRNQKKGLEASQAKEKILFTCWNHGNPVHVLLRFEHCYRSMGYVVYVSNDSFNDHSSDPLFIHIWYSWSKFHVQGVGGERV